MTPGLFIGVSLISLLPGIHAGAWVKAISLRMLRATRMRGIAQWQNPSVRVHTRMGPLRVVGAVPGTHEFRHKSFVYETDLASDARWRDAMARKLSIAPTRRLPPDDASPLHHLLTRAEQGEPIHIVRRARRPDGVVVTKAAVREATGYGLQATVSSQTRTRSLVARRRACWRRGLTL